MSDLSKQFSRLAFVDLETTGLRAQNDRITEVGVVLCDDFEVIETWSSLVNPGVSIPQPIQELTGISNLMVADAPYFDELALELFDKLADRIVIAHNAQFDVGFLGAAFKAFGFQFRPKVVCTVNLSRKLYPQAKRHRLDDLIKRFDLRCDARHRALDDAAVLPGVIAAMRADLGTEPVLQAMAGQFKRPNLPAFLDEQLLRDIPSGPGVYFFYDEKHVLLYVGKSVNMRERVMSHFSSAKHNDKEMRLAQTVRDVQWQSTAGELGALLLEAELIKSKSPIFNKRLRRSKKLLSIYWHPEHQPSPNIIEVNAHADVNLADCYGLFKTKKTADNLLRKLADEHHLCHNVLGFEKGKGPCFAFQLKKCKGVCAGVEPEIAHQLRLHTALLPQKIQTWPYPGLVALREYDAQTEREDFHLINAWRYLGCVHDRSELVVDSCSIPALEMDIYQILRRFLAKKQTQVIELPSA